MKHEKKLLSVFLILTMALIVGVCSSYAGSPAISGTQTVSSSPSGNTSSKPSKLPRTPVSWNLYAAGGLKPALDVLVPMFMEETGDKVTINYSPAGTLYAQIVEGQPCDLFFSADWSYVKQLEEQGLTVNSDKLLSDNMVLVVSGSAADKVTSFKDLTKDGVTFAICDSGAPIGVYAETGLKSLGLWKDAEKNLVARPAGHGQLVTMIQKDSVDATILFSSVANSSGFTSVATMDQADSGEIIFGTAAIKGGQVDAANEFVDFVRKHMAEFEKYGWKPYEG